MNSGSRGFTLVSCLASIAITSVIMLAAVKSNLSMARASHLLTDEAKAYEEFFDAKSVVSYTLPDFSFEVGTSSAECQRTSSDEVTICKFVIGTRSQREVYVQFYN